MDVSVRDIFLGVSVVDGKGLEWYGRAGMVEREGCF